MKPYFLRLLSIAFVLSTLNHICVASAQETAVHAPVWNGARKPLTDAEKITKYLSTGSITCHSPAVGKRPEQYFHGTGQITLFKDTVTTAAHNFIDHSTCRPWAAPWSCEFRTEDGGLHPIDMDRSRFGFSMKPEDWKGQSPAACKTENSKNVEDDWAVIKLSREVSDATPYQILEINISDKNFAGRSVVEIAGYTSYFLDRGKETPSRERCLLQGRSPVGGSAATPLILSNCGGGPGTSGSGLYIGSDGSPETSKLIAIYHGPLLGHGMHSALYVPVAGRFLAQLQASVPR